MVEGGQAVAPGNLLVTARDAIAAEPLLIDMAASNLKAKGMAVPEELLVAFRSLQLRRWIFLRDSSKYSIFIHPNKTEAYAVLGLHDPIALILRGTGVILETGVVHYLGAYVCDGLITSPVWLGEKDKQKYSELFQSLKASGNFHLG